MNLNKQRARNAMIGLAIGDAVSWTSMYHRSALLPMWTRRIRREMDAATETSNVITVPMPFSLNQPAEHFNLTPTAATEWMAFSAEMLLSESDGSYDQRLLSAWKNLAASSGPIRGSISTQAALHNIRNGILPPHSRKENPHYFDDSAMCRAVPIGIVTSGDLRSSASLSHADASVTNSEDGIWGAQAIAAIINALCAGDNVDIAMEKSLEVLPETSWIKRTVDDALRISKGVPSIFSILPELHEGIVNREYSYGNSAPETLALAFTIVRAHGNDFNTSVMTAASFSKSSESLPAIVGALSGAMNVGEILNVHWTDSIQTLKGICIPEFAGKNFLSLTEQIAQKIGQRRTV